MVPTSRDAYPLPVVLCETKAVIHKIAQWFPPDPPPPYYAPVMDKCPVPTTRAGTALRVRHYAHTRTDALHVDSKLPTFRLPHQV